jgi:hypothetical protein
VLTAAFPAQGWNATGHRVVAAIAYQRLTPGARAKIDALLSLHPDYATLLTAGAGPDPEDKARAAFLAAAVWPDVIKSDRRFYDDTRANAQPTPSLPGFPSTARHTDWHYIDLPYSPDGTALVQPKSPNALEQLKRLLKTIGPNDPNGAYDLPWLIHLEGDVHQPLHSVSRFVKSEPAGDQGGNLVFVTPGRNLHAFWDDLAGTDASEAVVLSLAREISAEYIAQNGNSPHLSRDPTKWVEESRRLAETGVYTFGLETGSREHPLALPPGYEASAQKIARNQIASAGFRLADVLNARFK